jgi:hypothetical protein
MNPPNNSSFNPPLFLDFELPLLRKKELLVTSPFFFFFGVFLNFELPLLREKVLIDIKDAFATELDKCDIF